MGARVEVHLLLHDAEVLLPGRVVYRYEGTAGLEFDRSNEAVWSRWDGLASQFGVRPLTNTGEHRAIPRDAKRRERFRTGPQPIYRTPGDVVTGQHGAVARRAVTLEEEPTRPSYFEPHSDAEESASLREPLSDELPRSADRASVLASLSAREPTITGNLTDRSAAGLLVGAATRGGFGLAALTNTTASWFLLLHDGVVLDAHILPATGYELGDRLFAEGFVSPAGLQSARAVARAQDREIGSVLVEAGEVSEAVLANARIERSATILADTLRLTDGTFRYIRLERAPYNIDSTAAPTVWDAAWPRVVGEIRAHGSRWLHEAREARWKSFPVLVHPHPFPLSTLPLHPSERAFVDAGLAPPRHLWEVMSLSNLSRTGTTVLLLALEQMGALRFRDDPEALTTSVSRLNLLARRAAQARSENLFDALGAHWAASQTELERHYTQQRRAFDIQAFPDSLRERFSGDTQRILDGIDRAWRVLGQPESRAVYRNHTIQAEVVEAAAGLMIKQAEMSRWRGRLGDAARFYRRVLELFPDHEGARDGLALMDGL